MNFNERYPCDKKRNSSVLYAPIRYFNAVIESCFRTLKGSILGRKKNNHPAEVAMELHRSVKTQTKAHEFGMTQNLKGRKRRKQKFNKEEKWGRRSGKKKKRIVYFNLIYKFALKQNQTKVNGREPYVITKK